MGTISVSHLSRSYSEKVAVSDLNFQIPKGRITGLLGPNGAGKTTTLRLLTGSLNPSSGSIRFGTQEFSENKIQIQKKIGYLPESSPVYSDLIVTEFLSFLARSKGISDTDLPEKIASVSKLLDLDDVQKHPISFLSKGYKQRVCLAGALIHDPEYIILDEPSSGLDPLQIGDLKQLIRALGKNKTILLSSHILQEVEEICDHILVLSEGKLIADANVHTISKSGGCLVFAETELQTFQNLFSEKKYEIALTGKREGSFFEFRIGSANIEPETIFTILKNANFKIRSLVPEKNSLESVFEKLTQVSEK
ncbi:ABC transporter ATP-binding protein [Leptospira sp. WS92.C1]